MELAARGCALGCRDFGIGLSECARILGVFLIHSFPWLRSNRFLRCLGDGLGRGGGCVLTGYEHCSQESQHSGEQDRDQGPKPLCSGQRFWRTTRLALLLAQQSTTAAPQEQPCLSEAEVAACLLVVVGRLDRGHPLGVCIRW